jgi:nucleosome binding factor SPN SPT16 subunit
LKRTKRQQELMEKKIQEARRSMNLSDKKNGNEEALEQDAKDLMTYRSPADYPQDAQINRLKVDLESEALLVPIHGVLVPFHISTIKSMTSPDPDMRINFFIQGFIFFFNYFFVFFFFVVTVFIIIEVIIIIITFNFKLFMI